MKTRRIHRALIPIAVAALCTVWSPVPAPAQSRIGPPPRSPTLSPYLNLLRGPNDRGGLGFNYFMRTRPQQRAFQAERELNRSLNQLQRQQSALQREIESGLSPTGHATSFLNTGGYFPLRR